MLSSLAPRRAFGAISSRQFSSSSLRPVFAKMTIVGRLADTPELQTTSSGQEMLKFAVGTKSGRGENQKTSWFKVLSFTPAGKQRDYFASLEKGTLVYVEGEASMNQYQDAEGKTRNALSVIQKRLEVLAHNRKAELTETSEILE